MVTALSSPPSDISPVLPEAVAVGDFNHDGKLDLAVADTTNGSKSISVAIRVLAFMAA